jgi:hypothetical protein
MLKRLKRGRKPNHLSKTLCYHFISSVLSITIILSSIIFVCCSKKNEKVATLPLPPPVEYQVGYIETQNPYVEKYIRMNIAVAPSTTSEELTDLMNFFADNRYSNYDKVRVDIYDDQEIAKQMYGEESHLLAKLEMTKPNYKKMKVYDIVRSNTSKESEVLINEEKSIFLGQRSTTIFDSVAQANELLKLMEDYPERAIYTVTWLQPQKAKLTYSIKQGLLVRKIEGVSEEVWQGMTKERIERAAKGAGFGGKKTPGVIYSLKPYTSEK